MTQTAQADATPVWESELLMRSLGYTSVAGAGLAIGIFLSDAPLSFTSADIGFLIGLLGAFYPLHLAYASCFHHPRELANQRGALVLAGFVAFLWALVSIALPNLIGTYRPVAMPEAAVLGISLLLSFSYGFFLVTRYRGDEDGTVRHQVVWPVVFGVAVPIYFGAQFHSLQESLQPLGVVGVLWILAVATEPIEKPYKFGGLLGVIYASAFVFSTLSTSTPNLRTLLIAIAISAYLAVFESWRLTWYKYRRHGASDTVSDYYKVTAFVLTVSGLVMPLLYLAFSFRILALLGSAGHFLAAFAVWFSAAPDDGQLATRRWNAWKLAFGFSFACLLLIGAIVKVPEPTTPLPIVPVVGAGVLVTLVLWVSARFKIGRGERPGNWFLALLIFGSVALACLMLSLRVNEVKKSYAFLIYSAYVIFGIVIVFRSPLGRGLRVLRRLTAGSSAALTFFRVPTSLFILIFTELALLRHGVNSLTSDLAALSFFMSATAGFGLNDYLDVKRDMVNQPNRPYAAGLIPEPRARHLLLVSLPLAGIAAVFASVLTGRWEPLGALLGVLLYNPFVKRFGQLKWLMTGAICALPFSFTGAISDRSTELMPFCLAVILFVGGRELLMDILDLPGDRAHGILTLPVRIGTPLTQILAGTLQFCGILLLGKFAVGRLGAPSLVVLIPLGLLTSILWFRWLRSTGGSKRIAVDQMWYPIGLGIALLLS